MSKNAEITKQPSSGAEDSPPKDPNQCLDTSTFSVEVVPDFSDDNNVIVNPEITQLTCDIYYELERARDKYLAKKHELNHRGAKITDKDIAKLEQLEKRMKEWLNLLQDALQPISH